MGYYHWLHDLLFHLLSAPQSTWPDVARPPMNKRGLKSGGMKRSDRLETMALAGVLARGYDILEWWERNFLKIMDEHDAGMMTQPELYDNLCETCKGAWNCRKVYKVRLKLNKKMNRHRIKI